MSYVRLDGGRMYREQCPGIEALLAKYDDMYKYTIYIVGLLPYVIEKFVQPLTPWEHGWIG